MNRLLSYLWVLILVFAITSSSFLLYSHITAPYTGEEISEMYKNVVGQIYAFFPVNDGTKNINYMFYGTAFFYTKGSPLVRTNAHVVLERKTITMEDDNGNDVTCNVVGSYTYEFRNINGKKFEAKLLNVNEEKDIAYLLVDIRSEEYSVVDTDYDFVPQRGHKVCALTGSGEDNHPFSYIEGVISNPEHFEPESNKNVFIRTNFKLVSGNSGSPLIDMTTGKIIGILSMADEFGSVAIPIDYFKSSFGWKNK